MPTLFTQNCNFTVGSTVRIKKSIVDFLFFTVSSGLGSIKTTHAKRLFSISTAILIKKRDIKKLSYTVVTILTAHKPRHKLITFTIVVSSRLSKLTFKYIHSTLSNNVSLKKVTHKLLGFISHTVLLIPRRINKTIKITSLLHNTYGILGKAGTVNLNPKYYIQGLFKNNYFKEP